MLIWNYNDSRGLAANLAIAAVAASLANLFVFLVNPAEDFATGSSSLQPPGWAIGAIWVCLFLLLGTSRWLLLRRGGPSSAGDWIWFLLLFCAAYPLYTAGLKNLLVGLAGNAATAAFAIWVAFRIHKHSLLAASLVSLVAVWVTFASFLILTQVQRQHS